MNPHKNGYSQLTTKVAIGLMVFVSACNSGNATEPNSPSQPVPYVANLGTPPSPNPLSSPIPIVSTSPSPEIPHKPSPTDLPNSIAGNWKVVDLWSHSPERSDAIHALKNLVKNNQNQLVWKMGQKQGTLEFSNLNPAGAPTCSVSIEFDVSYCCPKMHRIFLRKTASPTTEAPAGCIHSLFAQDDLNDFVQRLETALQLENAVKVGPNTAAEDPDTFRFIHDVDQTVWMGPYWQEAETDFQTAIRMVPIP